MTPEDITSDPDNYRRVIAALPMEPIPRSGAGPAGLHATHQGVLRLASAELRVYQLSDGSRVFDADDVERFFGGSMGDILEIEGGDRP